MQNLITGVWLEEVDAAVEVLRAVVDGGDWSEWFRERAEDFLTMVEGSVALARGHIPEAMAGLLPLLDDVLPDELAHWALYRLAEAAAAVGRRAGRDPGGGAHRPGGGSPSRSTPSSRPSVTSGPTPPAGRSRPPPERALETMATAIDARVGARSPSTSATPRSASDGPRRLAR